MVLVCLLILILVVDLAAVCCGADTRPGFEYGCRWWHRRHLTS
jgi:hypothetical protein